MTNEQDRDADDYRDPLPRVVASFVGDGLLCVVYALFFLSLIVVPNTLAESYSTPLIVLGTLAYALLAFAAIVGLGWCVDGLKRWFCSGADRLLQPPRRPR